MDENSVYISSFSSFSSFDYTEFPNVNIKLVGKIKTKKDFDDFTKEWLNIFERKQPFKLIFDTQNIGFINPKYCISMAIFIHKLHQREDKHLMEESKILVFSDMFYYMLCVTFNIQKPVAPVNIICHENDEMTKNYWIFP